MDSTTILCGHCQKDSGLQRSESEGADAARIQRIGWQVKLPILVGISQWFMACSKECMSELLDSAYAAKGVTAADKAKAKEITDDFKSRIPQMAQDTANFADKLQKVLGRVSR